jgi:hypothetical protein
MIQTNGQNGGGSPVTIQEKDVRDILMAASTTTDGPREEPELATRAKRHAKQHFQQNRFVIIGAGAVVTALLIFVATSMPWKHAASKARNGGAPAGQNVSSEGSAMSSDKSLFPIIDSGKPATKETHDGFLNERDLDRTETGRPAADMPRLTEGSAAGTLGSIPPFGEQQTWQAPPYRPVPTADNTNEVPEPGKMEHESTEKSSLVYVRSASAPQVTARKEEISGIPVLDVGLGLATGTRLRARLESAASTAVRTPVLAVIEYNYERDGEIIVPAGARVAGRMQGADRSGFVRIEFDSLMMPDGATVPIQAVAVDLEMRPLKGKVEGKNTGKNLLVRSLSGIGEVGAMLVGRGNLNQPLSESDVLRERVSDNIGEAGDDQVSRIAVTQHIVVTIPADLAIYIVLEKEPRAGTPRTQSGGLQQRSDIPASAEGLRQLLQLQRELNQTSTATR